MSLRVGLVGASGHPNLVLDGVIEMPGVELVAVAPGSYDEDMSAFMTAAAVKGVLPKVYGDYRCMLEAQALDVVAVTPAFHLHAAVTIEALRHGCAVYCEKPLALTQEDLRSVQTAWKAAGKPLGLMLNFRYEPAFYTAWKLVREGVIGDAILAFGQKTYRFGQRPDFFRRRETFGGLIPWVGIHAIDWCRWVSGRRFAAVTARHGNIATPGYPGLEDHAACLFEFDNGGSAVMTFDYLRPAGAPSHGDDVLRLTGSKGFLEVRLPGGLQVVTGKGPLNVPVSAPPYGPFADFLRSVMEPAHECLVSVEDVFRVTGIALAAREAADRRERVCVNDVAGDLK